MSARDSKKLLKNRKRRDARLFKATGGMPAPAPEPVEIDVLPPLPRPTLPTVRNTPLAGVVKPEPERTPMDDWWDEYQDADGADQLQMVRDKLGMIQPGDDWYEAIVPEAFYGLEKNLPEAEYVAFLEELRTQWPVIFADDADWHTLTLVHFYIAEKRWEEADRAVLHYAATMTQVGEPIFSLATIVRLAGREEVAQRLIAAVLSPNVESDLFDWAKEELIDRALLPCYRACMHTDATAEDLAAVGQHAVELGYKDTEKLRKRLHDFALCLAGKHRGWTRAELVKSKSLAQNSMYLLSASFLRWLCMSRGFAPVVADELRHILLETIAQMECGASALFQGLRRRDFEPAVAGNLDCLSLNMIHAPAAVIAMWHFYDFLAESELVLPPDHKSACSMCRDLWQTLRKELPGSWRHWWFLEGYLPTADRLVV